LILLDAYAVVAFTLDEPAADEVGRLMIEEESALTPMNLAETIDTCCRRFGLTEDDVRAVLAPILATGRMTVMTSTEEVAWQAARLRIRHYARDRQVSLADCFLLASASEGDEIATADPAVAAVAKSEEIGLIALPDSSGRRP
jgi:predicted nucleic acid-binding protein